MNGILRGHTVKGQHVVTREDVVGTLIAPFDDPNIRWVCGKDGVCPVVTNTFERVEKDAVSLPSTIESIRRLDVRPGETLVVKFDRPINQQEAADAKALLQPLLPAGVELIVTGQGIEFEVVSSASGREQ